jgi:hypothetical protein
MKKKRYIISSYNTNKYFHRQGTNTSFPARNGQVPIKRNSSMERLNSYSQISTFDDTQAFNVGREYQYSGAYSTTVNLGAALSNNHNKNNNNNESTINDIHNWEQLLGDKSEIDTSYLESSQTDLLANQSASFGFQQQGDGFQHNQNTFGENINPETDYETIVRSKNLYYDPQPQVIRKPSMPNPIVYNQNIMIRFLQPPPVAQGPLIIREVRPPQPPPPPPLVSLNLYLSKKN